MNLYANPTPILGNSENKFRALSNRAAMPKWHWRFLQVGTLLLISVYYLNYGAEYSDGSSEASNPLTMVVRLLAIALIVFALLPIRLKLDATVALMTFYLLSAGSLVMAWGEAGEINDTLFFNAVIQLPVLVALRGSHWSVDFAQWMRFIARCLVAQAALDAIVLLSGTSLWESEAFVGGLGNPSSFALYCSLAFMFCLLHPQAGRHRYKLAIALAASAIMTKALFAVVAVIIAYVAWAVRSWRRLAVSLILLPTIVLIGFNNSDSIGLDFVAHKLRASSALLGFIDYDVDSSASVSGRVEIHRRTYEAITEDPAGLLFGHLDQQPYWPMDSQVLTYLGSFGAPMLLVFVVLHMLWISRAWRHASIDGGFTVIALTVFGLIFLTNRILDYYPVATLYFLCIAAAQKKAQREHTSSMFELGAHDGIPHQKNVPI
jgi:hypothetical protein